MNAETDELRAFLQYTLSDESRWTAIPPKSAHSRMVHLSVFHTQNGKPIGVEFRPKCQQNLWICSVDAPQVALPNVKITPKKWCADGWIGANGKGANSNLSAYEIFHGYDLIRFGVKTKDDALSILEHLLTSHETNRLLYSRNG